jgi:CRISPR system Cascade subunit CasC
MSEQKNFINYHVLISHSPSCLNRDDQNMQKRAVFGGVERIRISSQSLKRAIRTSDYYEKKLGKPSIRSKKLEKLVERFCNTEELTAIFSPELIRKTVELIAGKEGIKEKDEVDSVAPWAVAEMAMFCEHVKNAESEKVDAAKLKKQIEKDAATFRTNFEKAVDIALSGRMATFGLMNAIPVDGALAVAHAITTHAAQADTDWFTAVDDLVQDAGEVGAGHLDTQEFSSGVFYRYASLNIAQLQENLGGATRERALEIAKYVFHMLCTVVPTAKQQSFAAHNPADFAIVSFADQPISMANAFERPITKEKTGGYYSPSVVALMEYWKKSNEFYGLDETAVCCAKDDATTTVGGLTKMDSLSGVEKWIENGGVLIETKE